MSPVIRIVAFEFAGGDAFFWGLALLTAAALVGLLRDGPRARAFCRLATIGAVIVLAASGTPLPLWFYGMGLTLSAVTLIARWGRTNDAARVALAARPPVGFAGASEDTGGQAGQAASATQNLSLGTLSGLRAAPLFRAAAVTLIGWCAVAAGWEFSYRLPPHFDAQKSYETLVVIADSVSSGLNGVGEETWPKQFRERYFGRVLDKSAPGATARSALKQASAANRELDSRPALVLIEIGGNDFFELIPPAQFAADLERLLTELERPNRQLVMLELPLPPFYNAYGRIQRDLAARHHVPLISKREFAEVIFTPDATLDTVHLSKSGHSLFADMVWRHTATIFRSPAIDSMTLYSLTPEQTSTADNFESYVILGKVEIVSPEERTAILAAVQRGIDQGHTHGAFGCFEPHHGVRLRRNGKTYDYVLCFHCLNVDEYVDDHYVTEETMDGSAQAIIDKHLKAAGIPQSKD
jgi:acyl-CoA thioesterase-1